MNLEPAAEDGLPRAGELVFRLDRDARKVFSLWTVGVGYDGPLTIVAGVVVQAEAVPNQAPILVLHDALNEPFRTAQSELRREQSQLQSSNAQ